MEEDLSRPCDSREDGRLERKTIIKKLADVLEPLDYVYAFWEGGAIAFDRSDQWSDIDLYADAEDGRIQDVFPVVEKALESLSHIELKYIAPSPPSEAYAHVFYRLAGAGKFLLIDIAVIKHTSSDKFLEPEIHGKSRFIFNKHDAVTCPLVDRQKLASDMREALARNRVRFDMLACFVDKEIRRGNYIEALDMYHRFVLGSLVEALRMKHDPLRYNFGPHYLRHDLPGDVVARLVDLYFVRDSKDLERKYNLAERWFHSTIEEIDI
jgi:hypothetical protein